MKCKSEMIRNASLGLLFFVLLSACKKEGVDNIPPGVVTDLLATPRDGLVVLEWNEPSDFDLVRIEVSYSPGTGVTMTQAPGGNGMTIPGLDNGTSYDFTVVTVDESGNKSDAVHVTAVPNPPFEVLSPNQSNYNPAGGTFNTDGSGHLIITINFNRPVDPATVKPALTIYFEGDAISQGTLSYTNQYRTLTFTTTDEIGDFGTFSGNIYFDFLLIGDDVGSGAVRDENGMVLDGDEDGEAGGNYELNLYIIG